MFSARTYVETNYEVMLRCSADEKWPALEQCVLYRRRLILRAGRVRGKGVRFDTLDVDDDPITFLPQGSAKLMSRLPRPFFFKPYILAYEMRSRTIGARRQTTPGLNRLDPPHQPYHRRCATGRIPGNAP